MESDNLNLEPFVQKDKQVMTVPNWQELDSNLVVGFSTRQGGISPVPFATLNVGLHVFDKVQNVMANRRTVSKILKFPLEKWVMGEQIHSSAIKKVQKNDSGLGVFSLDDAVSGVDGLYTKEQGILLVSLYADCTPLYFFSPKDKITGLAHAGWRGTVDKIGPKMVKIWNEVEGIATEDIHVLIGPSISKQAYEVDKNVIDQVHQVINIDDTPPYEQVSDEHYLLDLKELNRLLLRRAGIKEDQIMKSNFCTATNNDLFFSHRKEKGKTGRMMSYIGYRN
jgi:YfiH family protein